MYVSSSGPSGPPFAQSFEPKRIVRGEELKSDGFPDASQRTSSLFLMHHHLLVTPLCRYDVEAAGRLNPFTSRRIYVIPFDCEHATLT